MQYTQRWQRFAAGASLATLFGLTLSAVGVAEADTFVLANAAPAVSTPSLSAAISPDAGASATEYTYSIVVSDADTLNDLTTVTLCLYLTTGGDSTCATPDPATDVNLTWTQSTNAFTIDDGSINAYWALGTVTPSSSPTLTGTSGTFTYTFTVSEAMQQGEWTALVTATDVSAATTTNGVATTTVAHYSTITTRASQAFGTLATGFAGAGTFTVSPTVTSNGQTTYSMTAGNFTDGTYSFTLTGGLTSVEPTAGQVTFDCIIGSTFTQASATRIAATSTQISATQTSTGTVEGGVPVDNTCRLAHGGQRPVSTYAFAVVNAVGQG